MGGSLHSRGHGGRSFAGRLTEGMVSLPQQARAHSAGLGVSSGLDHPVCADGLLHRLCEKQRPSGTDSAHGNFPGPTGGQFFMEHGFLRHAQPGGRIGPDFHSSPSAPGLCLEEQADKPHQRVSFRALYTLGRLRLVSQFFHFPAQLTQAGTL